MLDGVESPVGELDHDLLHPSLARLADDLGPFDDPQGLDDFQAAGGDVGADAGSGLPLQGRFQSLIAVTVRHPVRDLQQIVGLEMQDRRDGLSTA